MRDEDSGRQHAGGQLRREETNHRARGVDADTCIAAVNAPCLEGEEGKRDEARRGGRRRKEIEWRWKKGTEQRRRIGSG